MKRLIGTVLILLVSFSSWSVAQPSLDERARQLRREALQLQQQFSELEAAAQQKRAQYANRELQRAQDVVEKLPGCVMNPKKCLEKPSIMDLLKLAKDELVLVGETASDLLELNDRFHALAARQLEYFRGQKAFEHTQREAAERGRPLPPRPQPQAPPAEPTDAELAENRDSIDLWCWENRGDRCFDGRPQEFEAFVSRHPEARRANDAVTHAPTTRPENILDPIDPRSIPERCKYHLEEVRVLQRAVKNDRERAATYKGATGAAWAETAESEARSLLKSLAELRECIARKN